MSERKRTRPGPYQKDNTSFAGVFSSNLSIDTMPERKQTRPGSNRTNTEVKVAPSPMHYPAAPAEPAQNSPSADRAGFGDAMPELKRTRPGPHWTNDTSIVHISNSIVSGDAMPERKHIQPDSHHTNVDAVVAPPAMHCPAASVGSAQDSPSADRMMPDRKMTHRDNADRDTEDTDEKDIASNMVSQCHYESISDRFPPFSSNSQLTTAHRAPQGARVSPVCHPSSAQAAIQP